MTNAAPVDAQRVTAARIAARTQLQDIRLTSSEVRLHRLPDEDRQLAFDLNVSVQVDWELESTTFGVRAAYTLNLGEQTQEADRTDGSPSDGVEDSADEFFANLKFELVAQYEMQMRAGDSAVTNEELLAYGSTTGALALYPYAREYVRDVTGRLGIAPLTLRVLLQPITQPAEAATSKK